MTAKAPRLRRPAALRRLVADPEVRNLLAANAATSGTLIEWIVDLILLEGLPFNLIVPDSRMLPPESIRFFYLDPNWLDAMVDGVMSIGGTSEPGAELASIYAPEIKTRVRAALGATSSSVISGFLLRSAVVADFPSMQVYAYADTAGTEPLTAMRTDLLAPTLMLALYSGQPARFDFTLPSHLLHFGVVADDAGNPSVSLRAIGGTIPNGQNLSLTPVEVPLRSTATQVIDVATLVTTLQGDLTTAYAPNTPPPFNSGAFAIEMLVGPEIQTFAPMWIDSFTATPSSIGSGGSSTLAWTITGADSAELGTTTVNATTGSQPVSPSATETYTLTATCGDGSVSTQAMVVVTVEGVQP